MSTALMGACHRSHGRSEEAPDAGVGCDERRLVCVRRASPCEPLERVEPVCAPDGEPRCPDGALPYAPPWADDRCLPLAGRLGPLFSDGVHEAPVPVPMGDRCAWVLPVEHDGSTGLVAMGTADRCDALRPPSSPESIVDLTGEADYVTIQASFVDAAGAARVLLRGWAEDPFAPFGVRALGVGLGRVRSPRIEIAADAWLFSPELDLGDAAIVAGGLAYAYGCPGTPVWLEEDCLVARAPLDRVDDPSAWALLGEGGFGEGAPVRVFGSGPHRSAVIRDPQGVGFLHVFSKGFGTELEIQSAPAPEGPWSSPRVLAACELPPGDPGGYCAGPVVYRELLDPLDPGALIVGYSVGTTSEDGAERRRRDPDAYWPRIVRVR